MEPLRTSSGCRGVRGDHGTVRQAMAARLARAVDTLSRLPATADARPAGTRSAWPEMIRESRFAIEATRRVSRHGRHLRRLMIWTGWQRCYGSCHHINGSCCGRVPAASDGQSCATATAAAARR